MPDIYSKGGITVSSMLLTARGEYQIFSSPNKARIVLTRKEGVDIAIAILQHYVDQG